MNLFLFILSLSISNLFSFFIKEIDEVIYVGGENCLSKYNSTVFPNESIMRQTYHWGMIAPNIMNGSDIGFRISGSQWEKGPDSLAFDNCLNWKQEHMNNSVRTSSFDYQGTLYHTTSGNWTTMNYTCMNSFIKSIEKIDNDTLWVCGTFGTFPRAFSVNKTTLEFIKFLDKNVMSCGRYEDEPMTTYRDQLNNLYVASGWGLYRPDKMDPDVPNNNSTMLYADWRLYRNLFTLPSAMAWVLSSDVNFINVVKEDEKYLYFFGHEISNQYGLNNQEDRQAWQSFMLRICKNDEGFKYKISSNGMDNLIDGNYSTGKINQGPRLDTKLLHRNLDYNKAWYEDTAHLPTKHFSTPLKINFGCYIGKRPRAISDNHYWGQTNVIYFNQLADVIYDPNVSIKFKSSNNSSECRDEFHRQNPLIGIFNRPGIYGTKASPMGSLCQLHINANIMEDENSPIPPYHKSNFLAAKNAHEEILLLNSMSSSNFYSRSFHRINGLTLHPYWNQGVLIGNKGDSYSDISKVGKCKKDYKTMTEIEFFNSLNYSNTAWPNELPNRLTSPFSAICQYSAAELYSFNATFYQENVEFKRLFLMKSNITNYKMHDINNDKMSTNDRRRFSSLMIVNILSTHGHLYRVVLCDFDNGMLNHGEDKSSGEWYNWCIFRHTDQPYLYRQYTPMESRKRGQSVQFRASSLLMDKKIVTSEDESSFPINRDPQFHIVKDVLRKGNSLHVLTTNNIHPVNMKINCAMDYTTCINCASDPECMWDNGKKGCIEYNAAQSQAESIVQDVLDRGFKCATFIKPSNQNVDMKANDDKVPFIFYCKNSEYWRGEIQWRINEKTVKNDPNQYIISTDQKYLTILGVNDSIKSVSCHGVKKDLDKLYDGAEYEWITADYSTKLLSNYTISKSRTNASSGASVTDAQSTNGWKNTAIAFIVLLILLSLVVLLVVLAVVCISTVKKKLLDWLQKMLTDPAQPTESTNVNEPSTSDKLLATTSTPC